MSPAPQRSDRGRSNAPTRSRGSGDSGSFPYRWGYFVSLFTVLTGVVVGAAMIIGAVVGFAGDVDGLRRAAGADSILVGLEEGEYFVFDEDGQDFGPFDVTVTRESDGLDVDTSPVDDGPTYDVDGRSGSAKASFDVPSAGQYRVDVDTSVTEIVGFAVGGDVGNERANTIIRGLVIGGVLIAMGLLGLVITGVFHARWAARRSATRYVATARSAVDQVAASTATATDTASERLSTADLDSSSPIGQARAWADAKLAEASDAARDAAGRVSNDGDASTHGRAPDFGSVDAVTTRSSTVLDQAQARLEQLSETSAGAVSTSGEAATATSEQLATELAYLQARLERGDSLRSIARDSRDVLSRASRDLVSLAQLSRNEAAAAGAVGAGVLAGAATDFDLAAAELQAGIDEAIEAAPALADAAPGLVDDAMSGLATDASATLAQSVKDIEKTTAETATTASEALRANAAEASDQMVANAMAAFDAAISKPSSPTPPPPPPGGMPPPPPPFGVEPPPSPPFGVEPPPPPPGSVTPPPAPPPPPPPGSTTPPPPVPAEVSAPVAAATATSAAALSRSITSDTDTSETAATAQGSPSAPETPANAPAASSDVDDDHRLKASLAPGRDPLVRDLLAPGETALPTVAPPPGIAAPPQVRSLVPPPSASAVAEMLQRSKDAGQSQAGALLASKPILAPPPAAQSKVLETGWTISGAPPVRRLKSDGPRDNA